MKSNLAFSLMPTFVFVCLQGFVTGQVIHVASHSASAAIQDQSDFVCRGLNDEKVINQAIMQLSNMHEQEVAPGAFLGLDVNDIAKWKPTDPNATVRRADSVDGHEAMHIQGSDTPYPGMVQDGLSLNLESYEAFELLVHSPSAIKIRVVLQDRNQQQIRYHEKSPSPGAWHRLRFHLTQPYRGSANLSDITSIAIQATTELSNCEFAIASAKFVRPVQLAHRRIHPDSFEVTQSQRKLTQGVDFDVDLDRATFWLFKNDPVVVRYRHGGGRIKLSAGDYHIDSPTGIELRSYSELDLQDATLIASDAYANSGQMIQSAPGLHHSHIAIRGGRLLGQRMRWPTRQNIGGIVFRDVSNVLIEGCEVKDFNSVGIAIVNTHLGDGKFAMPQRVTIANNRIARCATEYVDIRGDLYGEVGKGADHKAMLLLSGVRDFEIRGNRIEDSFGDAKWVVGCQDGTISGNTIENSRMGSYFVERSVRVIGTGNLIRNSGSRAVTIERGSHANTFANNVIFNSYREGLWLMGCSECLIQGNRFENNGWRNSQDLDSAIKIEWQRQFANDKASFNRITNNVIKLQPHQDQAIWIASGENSRGNCVSDNLIIGAKLSVRDDGVESVVERNQLQE